MDNKQTIPFNFTYYAMKLLGKNMYSNPWTAISEIVANGIDANAENVYVLIDMRDKEHAVVEIFDNGTGMSYEDLKDKYTLIGRNKRLDGDNVEGKTLGRKGIGKLAALYLSPCYYLYTKTDNSLTSWCVDTSNVSDSDIPAMQKCEYNEDVLISREVWSKIKTGTMIHLSNVDLRKIGTERLKSLPAIIADYYLETVISATIKVCVIDAEKDDIVFKEVSKKINFDTMYGIFDNTEHGYKDKIQPAVYITREETLKEVDYPRPTVKIDDNKYICSGMLQMMDLHGNLRDVPYEMKGWIGIHSSLDNHILMRNSKDGRRLQFHPNALRLYVRGKLAVNNLMNYVRSTAAFASYIEGEISFDVLDDDLFEDASTSNREGYKETDPRIKALLDIVGRIITALVIERNKAGNKVNEELKEIKIRNEAKAAQEKQLREAAEVRAQKEKENAERESIERKQAEADRDVAVKEKEKAEKRLFVLENNFVSEGEQYKHAMHLAINFAKEIRSNVCEFDKTILDGKQAIIDSIMEIDCSAAKIESLPKYVESATFSLQSPKINVDISELIKQYVETKGSKRLHYSFNTTCPIWKEVDFTELLMLVENIISNSIKAGSTELRISSCKIDGKYQIDFADNGSGLNPKYLLNPQEIFNLGETTTVGGFGIGGFHMKEIVERLGGKIKVIPSDEKGITIRVVI